MIQEASDLTEEDAWPRNYALAMEVFASKDSIEGAVAFAEKRTPNWTGE
jgi:enoyl-CoA hydratase